MPESERINWDHLKTREVGTAERDALRAELVGRARTVEQNGWETARSEWAVGDLAAVAYLLQDAALLEELDESEGSVLTRIAGNLFGFNGARKDIQAGLVETQAWFAKARAELEAR